ncbi:urea ABC transporter permease subunit UrtB [Yoonia sediminilitoris]|uniref:Amino acid/amide ABC transporter membrane protein 1 (HAAT family) n=1 Tax=Yoonia sediminilitoris TaxID=1286148 RepID=A0A2T6KMX9_9RHOB|nr:urea ABC transporter permease subunit UrtB [Yoonia sediminilitoris]PUB17566.1 amino acid/amide ABC transporter membrane protein 1 (HAAT family) [Yoonia sediminilitoris]RCW97861.1 amino acid/amide ABC transporter membrane protein 1 (HAAT family) [Yoonia sediminilitoris]
MHRLILAFALLLGLTPAVSAQTLQDILQTHADEVAKPGRRTVGVVLDDLAASGLPGVAVFLEKWQDKSVWQRDDGQFFIAAEQADTLQLTDIDSGEETSAAKDTFTQLKPNGGVRRVIATALVQFQLMDPDVERRTTAVASIARRPDASQLGPLLGAIDGETDAALKARKIQLANFLSASFAENTEDRIAAINSLSTDTSVEARAVLNQILTTSPGLATSLPTDQNVAGVLTPGEDMTRDEAYRLLVEAELAAPRTPPDVIRAALEANVVDGRVGNIPVAQLGSTANRERAYAQLAAVGTVAPLVTQSDRNAAIDEFIFFETYDEEDKAITQAAAAALGAVENRVAAGQTIDLALDALSLASIYFLAAIGLAITFGVMRVINMAHGEFIMMGAYTGYVVQLFVPSYTASIIIALPLAFAVTFGAGVVMERLVIRHLYHRPLETLLATFGISIALQQLAKNIFGTQARPLTSPEWLDGALVFSDVVQISYIRIAIFVLALIFLGLILYVLKRTRLGLEVRAVTQNPGMAASMGINPDRINMLTFGLGSGIAGIAGVAIGLYAKVTSEMGADYIVQSFMTVVVGGVGNVWGTLAGASLIGFLQKGIEWLNPSNTLAAQTYMILFIILFIQFRPKGIVALKGRAAAD